MSRWKRWKHWCVMLRSKQHWQKFLSLIVGWWLVQLWIKIIKGRSMYEMFRVYSLRLCLKISFSGILTQTVLCACFCLPSNVESLKNVHLLLFTIWKIKQKTAESIDPFWGVLKKGVHDRHGTRLKSQDSGDKELKDFKTSLMYILSSRLSRAT